MNGGRSASIAPTGAFTSKTECRRGFAAATNYGASDSRKDGEAIMEQHRAAAKP
jgi:hypothetical protein